MLSMSQIGQFWGGGGELRLKRGGGRDSSGWLHEVSLDIISLGNILLCTRVTKWLAARAPMLFPGL